MDQEGSVGHVVDPQEAGPREGPYEEHPVGNVSYRTRESPDCKRRCCISRVNLTHVARYRACLLDALTGVHHSLGLPMTMKMDLTHARCINEFAYCRKLSEKLGVWREDPPEDVSLDRVCLSQPLLRVGLDGQPRSDARTIDRDFEVPLAWCWSERKNRYHLEVMTGWHHPEVVAVRPDYARRVYVGVPLFWEYWEVPYHFRSESPPLFAYLGFQLMADGPDSPL